MLCIHKTKKPYVCLHCQSFHQTKNELESHYIKCKLPDTEVKVELNVEPPMAIERMRFLLAVLLKKFRQQQDSKN